jgi:hypothetical protein
MGKKENPSEYTKRIRSRIIDESSNRTLHALIRSLANAQAVETKLRLSFAHEKHIEMIKPFQEELEGILGREIEFYYLAMLNEALSWGGVTWHFGNNT